MSCPAVDDSYDYPEDDYEPALRAVQQRAALGRALWRRRADADIEAAKRLLRRNGYDVIPAKPRRFKRNHRGQFSH